MKYKCNECGDIIDEQNTLKERQKETHLSRMR
jgi:DNA-directed RNA polymerase subunit RPC12/RpoP